MEVLSQEDYFTVKPKTPFINVSGIAYHAEQAIAYAKHFSSSHTVSVSNQVQCVNQVSLVKGKLLTCEIADFAPSAHAQSDIPGHAFRKRWLFTEI